MTGFCQNLQSFRTENKPYSFYLTALGPDIAIDN